MARTVDHILAEMIANQALQLAHVAAENEKLKDALARVTKELEELKPKI